MCVAILVEDVFADIHFAERIVEYKGDMILHCFRVIKT